MSCFADVVARFGVADRIRILISRMEADRDVRVKTATVCFVLSVAQEIREAAEVGALRRYGAGPDIIGRYFEAA